MSFVSLSYLTFFPLVVLIYFALPAPARWAWLLGASCYFYMVFIPKLILVLALLIVVDYFAGIRIESSSTKNWRRFWLILSLIANISVLFVFKYFNFFSATLAAIFSRGFPSLRLILPLGLSFHTFQAMAYTIEVYLGRQKAERHFGIYALYVMFFPQLVAGPIERPQRLLPQLHRPGVFTSENVISGLRLILWGVFKKLVIADGLAEFVDWVFGTPHVQPAANLVLASVLFAFQIYYDFSGYTDIARGSARVLGFELMENFRMPYFSFSVTEFWRRWNISLSSWFRDYVYIPLGGSRRSDDLTLRNLLIVFVLSGLWHGANMTFVIWGLLHFLYVAGEKILARRVHFRLPKVVHLILTFTLVTVAWVFFRAASVTDALEILRKMPFLNYVNTSTYWSFPGLKGSLLLLLLTLLGEFFWHEFGGELRFKLTWRPLRWFSYYALILSIFAFGTFDNNRFIYFQF